MTDTTLTVGEEDTKEYERMYDRALVPSICATLLAFICAVFLTLGATPLAPFGVNPDVTAAIVTGVVGLSALLVGSHFVNRGNWGYKAAGWAIIGFAVTAIVLVATHH